MIELLFVCIFTIGFQFRTDSNSVIPTSESSYLTNEVGKCTGSSRYAASVTVVFTFK